MPSASASQSERIRRLGSSCFQCVSGPMPIARTSKGERVTNILLNQGKPTEILPQPAAS